ncbi:MAG: KilA-N domain-containing protein [Bacteroidetes bacterium]|nr:KilA-N domain-containing protein [Bacteroidota bacterium]
MSNKKIISVEGLDISVLVGDDADYISLTDIAKKSDDEPRFTIRSWMRNNNTLAYLDAWESVHNRNFKRGEAATFRFSATNNSFSASVTAWIETTGAIGLQSRPGRYGGTYAHREIALNFCYWFSPTFQVYLIKEFDRLKTEEAKLLNTEWDVKRIMSKANYRIHTEAVRNYLIPPKLKYTKQEGLFFASEADLINMALFGVTAKQWREANPDLKGNMRDHATPEQLLVLSNLQALNASLLEWGSDDIQRLELLNKAAIDQMSILVNSASLNPLRNEKYLGKGGDKK